MYFVTMRISFQEKTEQIYSVVTDWLRLHAFFNRILSSDDAMEINHDQEDPYLVEIFCKMKDYDEDVVNKELKKEVPYIITETAMSDHLLLQAIRAKRQMDEVNKLKEEVTNVDLS